MNIIFKQVDYSNWRECILLKVSKEQENFIESNTYSVLQSIYEPEWKSICIYDGDTAIGYAMHGIELDKHRVWLDRFMIDERFQGKKYGKIVLKKLIDLIKNTYDCNEIYLSIKSGNIVAQHLYESLGFKFNGEIDCNEEVMVLYI